MPVLTFAEYQVAPGLSNSAMKDLAVSPLRFWHRHINPARTPMEPTPEMVFGSALHCAILEADDFDKRYACQVDETDFPECLRTIEDLRIWIKDAGFTPKGTRKAEVIAQAVNLGCKVPILDLEIERAAARNVGKTVLLKADWWRLGGAAQALRSEPAIDTLLNQAGRTECPMFAKDPETGVQLKACMDWVTDGCTLDLKTFTQMRGKSIDESVASAIWYERYYRQAYFYSMVRGLAEGMNHSERPDFVLAFVESEPPHEVRLKVLRPKTFGEVNLYWETARHQVRDMIRAYKYWSDLCGDKPWKTDREIQPLADQEMPQQAY